MCGAQGVVATASWVWRLLGISGLALGSTRVEATPIFFDFAGVIGIVQSGPPGIEPGCAVTGRYTFESSTPGGLPRASYDKALLGIEFFLGGRRVEFAASGTNRISVYDANYSERRGGADSYRVMGSALTGLIDGMPVDGALALSIILVSTGESPIDDFSLPLLPVIVEEFQHAAYFQITVDTPLHTATIVSGQVTSITPEPSTGSLVSVGLILLAWQRSRRG